MRSFDKLEAWKEQLKTALADGGGLNRNQVQSITEKYQQSVDQSREYEQTFAAFIDQFGNVDSASATSRAQASVSLMEKNWLKRTKERFGIDKLSYETKRTTPSSLDVNDSTPSKFDHHKERMDYLKDKFNMQNGLEFTGWAWRNGGYTRVGGPAGSAGNNERNSKLIKAFGMECEIVT